MKLNRGLNLAKPTDQGHEWTIRLRETCIEGREWYDNNAMYLYEDLPSPSEFVGLLNAAGDWVAGDASVNVWHNYLGADKEVRARLAYLFPAGELDAR